MPSYVEKVLNLLGESDPFEVQGQLIPALEQAIAEITPADLGRPEGPGKWSILQVIEHLVDAEIVHGYRIRMILEHESPELLGWDPVFWGKKGGSAGADVAESLSLLRLLRTRNLRLLQSLGDGDLERQGIHGQRGVESIRAIISLTAGHDLIHRHQIQRIREALDLQ